MAKHTGRKISRENVQQFNRTFRQLESFYKEIAILSKKKPDGPLNEFKLGFINQMLEKANLILGEEYRPFPNFTTFDVEASIPSASDVVMMLALYIDAMNKFRGEHHKSSPGSMSSSWNIENEDESDESEDDDEAEDDDLEEDETDDEDDESD